VGLVDRLRRYRTPIVPTRVPVLGLTHDEVAGRYRGFEGDAWGGHDWRSEYPFVADSGLGDLSQLAPITEALAKDFGPGSDLIYVGGVSPPAGLPSSLTFVGYDYGYYESVWGYYSVTYNEIIYGLHPAMREFATLLNEHLLLPDAEQADQVGTVRQRLLAAGVDLETDSDEWYAMGVWLYSRGGGAP
jgi:hypothetical protein